MPAVTVEAAVLQWNTPSGEYCIATRGQVVDVPDEVIRRHPDAVTVAAPATPAAPEQPSPTDGPSSPAQTAPKPAWVDYADALHNHTGGTQGMTRDAADQLTRRDLIDRLAAQPGPEGNQP